MSSKTLSRNKNSYEDIIQIFQKNLKSNITGKLEKTYDSSKLPHITSKDMAHDTAETMTTPAKAVKRNGSLLINKNNSAKKSKTVSKDDTKLKFGCSFCPERFAVLVGVRDHIRNNHKEEYEYRKEQKLNGQYSNIVKTPENVTAKRLQTEATPENVTAKKIPTEAMPENVTAKKLQTEATPENVSAKKLQSEPKTTLLYRCNACRYASISYDQMIEHCQDHLLQYETSNGSEPDIDTTRQTNPQSMNLDVDDDTYKVLEDNQSIDAYKFIDCDYKLLQSDQWPGNSDELTKPEMDAINCSSIYYFTRIIRLSSSKKASVAPYMLFECLKCKKYIDPHSTASHVQENSCDENQKGYPCYVCKLPFLTETSMYLHYKTHQVANADMKYKKIEFNSDDDDAMNAILLKAAGREMKDAPARNKPEPSQVTVKNTVEHKSDNAEQGRAQNTVQKNSSDVLDKVKLNIDNKTSEDARMMIIAGCKTDSNKLNKLKLSNNATKSDKVVVYKCQCRLCFHMLDQLFNHLENCSSDIVAKRKTCICSLDFDESQYQTHYKLHSQGHTQFVVKKVTVADEEIITLDMNQKEHDTINKDATTSAIKDRVDTEKTNNNSTKVKNDPNKQSKAISNLISSILKIPNRLAEMKDPKIVEAQQLANAATPGSKNSKPSYLIGASVVKSGDLPIKVANTVNETNEEVEKAKQNKTNVITQSESNVIVSDVANNNNQHLAISKVNATEISSDGSSARNLNEIVLSGSGNTEEDQFMVDTTVEVEMTQNNIPKKAIEEDLTVGSNKTAAEIVKNANASEKHDEDNTVTRKDSVISNTENLSMDKSQFGCEINKDRINNCDESVENKERDLKCNTINEKCAQNRVYTEDELLNETDATKTIDSDVMLTDDEDPILLYDDDEILNQDNAE